MCYYAEAEPVPQDILDKEELEELAHTRKLLRAGSATTYQTQGASHCRSDGVGGISCNLPEVPT